MKKENHVKLHSAGLEESSQDKDLTGEDFSVLLHLVGRLDHDDLIRMTRDEIAEALGLETAEISRILEKLTGKGILRRIKNDQNRFYVLNPKFESKTLGLNVLRYLSDLT